MITLHEHIFVRQPAWISHAHGLNAGMKLCSFERWLTQDETPAFDVEPTTSRKVRARLEPVVSDPDEMAAILADYG